MRSGPSCRRRGRDAGRLPQSAKSWSNALSDARAALALLGCVERRINRRNDLSPAWREIWSHVLALDDPTLRPALSRFVYFRNPFDILPQAVTDGHATAYRDALEENEI